jgi:DNA primase
LRKGEPRVVLAYDGDKAGVAAALKASQMLSAGGFDGGVLLFPDGQDPADLISKGQSEAVAKLLREAKPFIPFVLEMIVSSYNINDPREKEVAFGTVKQYLDTLSDIIKDAYIPMAATMLGLSPSFFGKGANPARARENFTQKRDDVGQLSILKTLIEKPHFIDTVLNVMDVGMFGAYAGLFSAIINAEITHPGLAGLSIDENFKVMEEEELSHALIQLLTIHYMEKLKSIPKDTSMVPQKKAFLVKKIKMDILPRLKKGELVAFDLTL